MGSDCEKQLAKLETHYRSCNFTKIEELWKKYGCLGRLHNLIRYIRLTAGRREEFKLITISNEGGDLNAFDGLEVRSLSPKYACALKLIASSTSLFNPIQPTGTLGLCQSLVLLTFGSI